MSWGQRNAPFYATVRGQTDKMTGRCGDKSGGVMVTAQSFDGDIRVHMYRANGTDYVTIDACSHKTKATDILSGPFIHLYHGPINRLIQEHKPLLHIMAEDAFRKECEDERV